MPGTKPLTMSGDIASDLVAGVDRFLLRQIDESTARRASYWKRDFSSEAAYLASVEPNRKRLAHILGVRDERLRSSRMSVARLADPDVTPMFEPRPEPAIHDRARDLVGLWRRDRRGARLGPGHSATGCSANIIVIPDADQTPEQLAGLTPGVAPESQVARRLAESSCRVIVPALIDRTIEPRNGRAKLTNREFIYRSAFELGRHIIGYEVQKVLALVDLISREQQAGIKAKIGIFGYGEGGAIALYAAALDPRIDAVCVSGYFGDRNDIWRQPVDRNVFGLLEQFGDAEVAEPGRAANTDCGSRPRPRSRHPARHRRRPGRLTTPELQTVKAEVEKARELVSRAWGPKPISSSLSAGRTEPGRLGPAMRSAHSPLPSTPAPASNRPGRPRGSVPSRRPFDTP